MSSVSRQRAWRALLGLEFERRAGRTVLTANRHHGPLLVQKALYPESPQTCHVAVLHPPGGIAAGDELRIDGLFSDGSQVVLTTPGAAKWYRSEGEWARQEVRFSLSGASILEWLPRETIFFEGARVFTRLDIALSSEAKYFGWEISAFGRRASGERWNVGSLALRTTIRQGQRLLWAEAGAFDAGSGFAESSVGLAGFAVSATFVVAGVDVADGLLEECRRLQPVAAGHFTGITRVPGVWVARYLGDSTEEAFDWFSALWALLRPELTARAACPPRVWAC